MAAHGSLGRGEAFPVVLQLLMDNPDGLTVMEIANFARNQGLVEETEVAGIATQTRVRRAINSMIELGYAVEAGKGPSKAMRFKISTEGIQQDIDEGILEALLYVQKRLGNRLPAGALDGDKLMGDLRRVAAEHSLLGMKLREAPADS